MNQGTRSEAPSRLLRTAVGDSCSIREHAQAPRARRRRLAEPSPRGPRSLGAIGSRAAGDRTTLPYLRVVPPRLTGTVGAGRLPAAHLGARPGASVTTSIPAQYWLH